MLYLFLGYAVVGLYIILGIPLEDTLTSGQYALLICVSVVMDFLRILPYLAGRYFSQQPKLHWATMLFFGVVIGVFTRVILPKLGIVPIDLYWYWLMPSALFFAVAFIPKSFEFWRVRVVESKPSEPSENENPVDAFKANEQFFKCPTCEHKIGLFSKTANSWGKRKVCPQCNQPFEAFIKLKTFTILILPTLALNLIFLRPLVVSLGINGGISNGLLSGILVLLSMRYRRVRNANVTE
ncbi:hypothetical protein [Paraferrimonas haliotis]|uniref:hypothetical protein n=1 Tax=Paraferrimonas haliotis TaxID=2013866 RepID=UPI000BA8DFF1|nr:hypothetical protein [Paraferrimonas haliotis]